MQKISFIFHIFFKLFLIFLFVFIWIRYFVKSLVSAIIISAIATFVIDIISNIIFKSRNKKIALKAKEKQDAEDMFFSLAMSTSQNSFFMKLLNNKAEIKSHKNFISYKEEDKKTILYPSLTFTPLISNDVAQILRRIKKEKPRKIIIVAGEIEKECFNFIKIYGEEIILLDKYETYEKLYKEKNVYPEITINKKQSRKPTIKELLEFSFNRSRIKGYLLSSLALLFCSLFVKASLYYCIVTSLLVLFAIISLFSPFNHEKQKVSKLI